MNKGKLIPVIFLMCLLSETASSQSARLSGQAIGWTGWKLNTPVRGQSGLRYLPSLTLSDSVAGKFLVEAEGSVDVWGTVNRDETDWMTGSELTPYRLWIKISGRRSELRAGLQKINFGSASMLRPLMWFDRMDPRDPLQLTKAVIGILGRHYFQNNANLWLWALYGNQETKGWEVFPTTRRTPELGGRLQVPVPLGELALSTHHRYADPSQVFPDSLLTGNRIPENRLAIDGKFDLGVGLWFETSLTRQELKHSDLRYRQFVNAGTDYTFALGNGLHLTLEGLYAGTGNGIFSTSESVLFGGTALSYPISLLHQLQLILFYDFSGKNFYRFLNWSVTLDNWSFYLMGFWNPENYQLYQYEGEGGIFSGPGFQLMLVFNH